ncbi:hypothetical protein SK1NUM_29710 [Arachnia rubra]|jgi:hypothetical protein|nr:hypothetical protein SK1NUM_29710 [Arachnia rubra]
MNQSGYGLTVDGIMGPQTIEYLQVWFGNTSYVSLVEGDRTIKELQGWLGFSYTPHQLASPATLSTSLRMA